MDKNNANKSMPLAQNEKASKNKCEPWDGKTEDWIISFVPAQTGFKIVKAEKLP